ncbi:unnamed protein product [Ilex paraguariensis]|uniref:Uncharacterized protein n=1 Tax=Ilex paraguariensis TaxID=185542 RepID=A0ABC8TD11_9AQUA
MEREQKVRERELKKEEFMGIKLKRGFLVGKRGGNCTPSPTWKFSSAQPDGSLVQNLTFPTNATLSARKLGANLWEVQPHLKVINMSKGDPRLRHHHKDNGFVIPNKLEEDSDGPPEQPATVSSLRRHVAASLTQHHQSVKRIGHPLQPASPASYSSSMEMAPHNPAVTPSSSLEFKGRIGESSYSLKTSTELLKVLNRIWSLEEQYASSMSLVKALKKELDHCRTRIKELLQEKKRDRQEMDDLMKQIAMDRVVGKNVEQDRIKDAIQSVRDELEYEKKLRKHSESLHIKQARELSEVKSAFSKALKELERERKARILLEDLCDEFAKGVSDYEQEVRFLKHKPQKDRLVWEHPDRLILHISETWLDERMQMKLAEAQCNVAEKNTIVDNLSFEIKTFLRAKQSIGFKTNDELSSKKPKERRHSLESFHLTEAASAPRKGDDGEDSVCTASHSFELNRGSSAKLSNGCWKQHGVNALESHPDEIVKSNPLKKKVRLRQVGQRRDLSSLEMHLEEPVSGGKTEPLEAEVQVEKLKISEVAQEGLQERSESAGVCDHVLNNMVRKDSSTLEGMEMQHEHKLKEDSPDLAAVLGHDASPAQQWMSKLKAQDPEVSDSSSKLPRGVKENTLKAKLLEARLAGRQSRSKASKGSS